MRRFFTVPLVCGLVAACVTLVTQMVSRRPSFHPSLLLNVADSDPLSALVAGLDPSFQFTVASDHYDGVYFLAMALDPFALGQAHDLIDLAAYRYGHPFYSWVASVLSFGQPAALPWVFWGLSVLSMAAAAYSVALLATRLGASPWLGLTVSFSPGLLFSASTALTEPFQLALITALLVVWLRSRTNPLILAALVVALCLTKEQLVLVPVALGLTLLPGIVKERRIPWLRVAPLLAGPLSLGSWLWYARGRFSSEQSTYDSGNLGVPFAGWLNTFDLAGALRVSDFHASQIGSTAVPGLMATAALVVAGAIVGFLRRDPLGWTVVFQAALISTLGWRTLLYPHEMFRIPSVAALLAALLLGVHLSRHKEPRQAVPTVGTG